MLVLLSFSGLILLFLNAVRLVILLVIWCFLLVHSFEWGSSVLADGTSPFSKIYVALDLLSTAHSHTHSHWRYTYTHTHWHTRLLDIQTWHTYTHRNNTLTHIHTITHTLFMCHMTLHIINCCLLYTQHSALLWHTNTHLHTYALQHLHTSGHPEEEWSESHSVCV